MAVIYVNLQAEGSNNGTSWEDAYNNLQDALDNAEPDDEIWIARGEYLPSDEGNRNASFYVQNSVDIYGGFAGDETDLSERDIISNETILSGNINDEDSSEDNSYHVLRAGNITEETIVDGLTIRDGFNSNVSSNQSNRLKKYGAGILVRSSNIVLRNLTITDNQAYFGGGIYITGDESQVSLINNTISNNTATRGGGGLLISSPPVDVINNLFTNNIANRTGGGAYLFKGTGNFVNNTFSGNFSQEPGSAITAENGSALEISNSIVWDNNSTETGEQIYNKRIVGTFDPSTISVFNSLVENGFIGSANIAEDPLFRNPSDNNYRLGPESPAIDLGNNQLVTTELDLDNKERIVNEIVDLGAYEYVLTINEINGTDEDDELLGTSEPDIILGLDGNDTLEGREENDTLDGGAGKDTLIGELGDDSLIGDDGKDRLEGNEGNDTIKGGSDDDRLKGDDGDDRLRGDSGNDLITGGLGSDQFEFRNIDDGVDDITDFEPGIDKILIAANRFGEDLQTGSLNQDQFILGSSASTAENRFIFDNGDLFFDADGSGDIQQIQIATFSNGITLSHTDFLLS